MSSQPLLQTAPGTQPAPAALLLPSAHSPQASASLCRPESSPRSSSPTSEPFCHGFNFTVILGALAIGMLNFGDRVAFISAFLFTGVTMLTMIYALTTYHWRAKSIRMRGQVGFDDRFGPTFLAIILLLAVVNFVLRIMDQSKKQQHD